MKVTALILGVLVAMAAPASAAFLGGNSRLDKNHPGHRMPAGVGQPKPRLATGFGLGLSETSGGVSCCAKPIEQFKPGDLVLSAPDNDPEAPVVAKRVEEVFQRGIGRLIELRVGGQLIRTTHEHPFYVDSKALGKKWLAACALCPGDLLKSHDGKWVPAESVSDTDEDVTVYNMRIEDYHTYFVGSPEWGFSVLSHNTGCGPLTPGQQQEAADAAQDLLWHRQQWDKWNGIYNQIKNADNLTGQQKLDALEAVTKEIEHHQSMMDLFKGILGGLGF